MRKVLQFLAVSLLFAGAGALIERPVQAAVPSCGSGYICFYDDLSGTSLLAKKSWTDWTQSVCYGMGATLNGRVSYIRNDTSHNFVVSTGGYCGPTTGPIYAYSYGPMNSTFNNHIYSMFRVD
jgi:hypothetical protein